MTKYSLNAYSFHLLCHRISNSYEVTITVEAAKYIAHDQAGVNKEELLPTRLRV